MNQNPTSRFFGGVFVLALTFGGCRSDKTPPPPPPDGGLDARATDTGGGGQVDMAADSPVDAPAGQVELKIAWWGSPNRDMRTTQVIQMFEAANPNIKITTEHYASTQGMGIVGTDYWPTMNAHAANNTLPDIMQHDYAYIEEWTQRGLLLPLDAVIAGGQLDLANVPPALIDGGKVAGKVMGISLGLNTQAMVIDVDAFASAGVAVPGDDWTWVDFERVALEIKAKLGIWGAGAGLHGYTPGWKAVYLSRNEWVWSADNKALGYSDDAPWVEHWKMLLRLQAAGAIPRRNEEPTGSNVEALPMVTKKSAMEHVHSNQLVALWTAAGETRNLKMLPLPKVVGGRSPIYMKPSQYFSITSTSKHPNEAAKFIEFFTNNVPANQILGGERGVPVNTMVLAALKPALSKQAAESFDLIERGGTYATNLPPNDPPAWTTILNQIFKPKVVETVMGLAWTPEMAVEVFRREATEVLMGKMVPDSGVPDVQYPDAGASDAAPDVAVTTDASANPLSFFVTSTGSGAAGGNLGGLAGADAKCEALAAAVGAGGRGWRAYLSAQAQGGSPAVNAKDRVGAGPWRNQRGQVVAANITALLAGPAANLILDENGAAIPNDWHEVLTGTRPDGTVWEGRTCNNWTSTMGQSQVGIADDVPSERFSSHASGCNQADLMADGGQGRLYCLATTP